MSWPKDKKWLVFALTWLSYASFYLSRKNFSIVKSRLNTDLSISVGSLAAIDTIYLSLYAIGQFISGYLGDRFGAKKILLIGMLGSSLCAFAFGAGSSLWAFLVIFGLQGLCQSTGWPNNVKAVGPYFSAEARGKIMGLWSTNYQVGGLAASALAAFLLARLGWRSAFFVPGMVLLFITALLLVFLPTKAPETKSDAGNSKPLEIESKSKQLAELEAKARFSVWRIPEVWILGFAYFCLKLIRYSLLFWLPFYLHQRLGLGEENSGYLSIILEIGGVIGAILTGWWADRYGEQRTRMVAPLLFCLAILLWAYVVFGHHSLWLSAFLLLAIGCFIFGPDTLISGACAQDIGGLNHTGAVAGAINGLGSLGAIFQGILTAYVSENYGWDALFQVFTLLALLSALIIALALSRFTKPRVLAYEPRRA